MGGPAEVHVKDASIQGRIQAVKSPLGKEALVSTGRVHKTVVTVQVRWMIRRDMHDVLRIEQESSDCSWGEQDFLECLRQRNCIGMVAELEGRVVGFMVYELHKNRLHLLNFAVASSYRRTGIGAQMIDKLVNKLSQQRRQEIMLELRESNLAAQLFFHNLGFRATQVLRQHYPDTQEDAYILQFRLDSEIPEPYAPTNRIVNL